VDHNYQSTSEVELKLVGTKYKLDINEGIFHSVNAHTLSGAISFGVMRY